MIHLLPAGRIARLDADPGLVAIEQVDPVQRDIGLVGVRLSVARATRVCEGLGCWAYFDLADSASMTCYHCDEAVCVACGRARSRRR